MSDDGMVNLNNRMKAAMRQTETLLNSGAQGQKVKSPCTTSSNVTKGKGPLNTSTNPNR
jgi:hypothetical protein